MFSPTDIFSSHVQPECPKQNMYQTLLMPTGLDITKQQTVTMLHYHRYVFKSPPIYIYVFTYLTTKACCPVFKTAAGTVLLKSFKPFVVTQWFPSSSVMAFILIVYLMLIMCTSNVSVPTLCFNVSTANVRHLVGLR